MAVRVAVAVRVAEGVAVRELEEVRLAEEVRLPVDVPVDVAVALGLRVGDRVCDAVAVPVPDPVAVGVDVAVLLTEPLAVDVADDEPVAEAEAVPVDVPLPVAVPVPDPVAVGVDVAVLLTEPLAVDVADDEPVAEAEAVPVVVPLPVAVPLEVDEDDAGTLRSHATNSPPGPVSWNRRVRSPPVDTTAGGRLLPLALSSRRALGSAEVPSNTSRASPALLVCSCVSVSDKAPAAMCSVSVQSVGPLVGVPAWFDRSRVSPLTSTVPPHWLAITSTGSPVQASARVHISILSARAYPGRAWYNLGRYGATHQRVTGRCLVRGWASVWVWAWAWAWLLATATARA